MENYKNSNEVLKSLLSQGVSILDLQIAYEINSQIRYDEREFTNEELELIFSLSKQAYLDSIDIRLENIVVAAIDNINKLENADKYDLIAWSMQYEY